MSMFLVSIETDNEAFSEDPASELVTILSRQVIPRLKQGDTEHWLRDTNGNKVGEFRFDTEG